MGIFRNLLLAHRISNIMATQHIIEIYKAELLVETDPKNRRFLEARLEDLHMKVHKKLAKGR